MGLVDDQVAEALGRDLAEAIAKRLDRGTDDVALGLPAPALDATVSGEEVKAKTLQLGLDAISLAGQLVVGPAIYGDSICNSYLW